jgi:hypothetical protein
MSGRLRRNVAHLSDQERQEFIAALLAADVNAFADGVSYWDKQDEIHEGTHNHGNNSFLPWHRELVNRFEALLQQSNPDIALPYWDWTEDPRAADNGQGGTVNLLSAAFMGTASGLVDGPLAALHNGGALPGSREQTGDRSDPPRQIVRNCNPGAPGVASDATILASSNGVPQAQQWTAFRQAVEGSHNSAHGFFGVGGTITNGHTAFEDPFVFLLHCNVDRLFAQWQTQPGQEWRLDPDLVYGDQKDTSDAEGILQNLQPWDGTVQFGSPIVPWTGSSSAIEVKNCRHPSVVRPPCYDTLPLSVEQSAPAAGDPIRFLDVVEHLPTARALRLRVRGCRAVTANATVTAPFTLLSAAETSPVTDGFEVKDLLVWVLFSPGAAGTVATGTLSVSIAETGDAFSIRITANVVANPTVGTSLVLDRSGSMQEDSGVPLKTRMEVLHDAAPLFVALLNDDDGVGVVAFDTDADPLESIEDAGPMIGGTGRADALQAIQNLATNPAGLTAIGDGIEAAAAQLVAVVGTYDEAATIVFTDGHETADKTIAAASSSVNSKVFAIGLGTADQLNPGALLNVANGTGGYVLLTGNAGNDDQLLLQKYFAQVLAGATNAAIVVDPDGFVPLDGEVVVPFSLTDADVRADVIVLGEMAGALRVKLIAPDGTSVAGGGATEVAAAAYRVLRVTPADVTLSPRGEWQAVLSIDREGLNHAIGDLRERLGKRESRKGGRLFEDAQGRVATQGVPFSLSVQAHSALRLGVTLSQGSRLPGVPGRLEATITDSGIPLAHSVVVNASVTAPDGAQSAVPIVAVDAGIYRGEVPTSLPGIYRVLVRAHGADTRGTPFTREELRTLAVWSRGDDPPPVVIDPDSQQPGRPGLDTCRLLACLLQIDGVARLIEQHNIDPDAVRRCVKRACTRSS